MMKEQNLLIIHPHTYICLIKQNYILYNTINGKYIIGDNSEIAEIIAKILSKGSQWVNQSENLNRNAALSNFSLEIKEKNIGDYIKNNNGKNYVQFYPIKNIQHDIKRYKGNEANKSGDYIPRYLHELSIQICSQCTKECRSCNYIYKQFPFCHKEKGGTTLDLKALSCFLNRTVLPSLYRINIIGGDIWGYPQTEELNEILSTLNTNIYYYSHISNFDLELTNKNIHKHIVVLVDMTEYVEAYSKSFYAYEYIEYYFFVTNEAEVNLANSLIKRYRLPNFQIRPLYNKNNNDFFKKFVFINEEDIFERIHNFQDIFRNNTLNSNYFGKMSIFANGEIYTDINQKSVGNIFNDSISEVIRKELEIGKSWLRTRKSRKPCNKCVLQDLCPSTSNIEVAMRKNNLCFKSIE